MLRPAGVSNFDAFALIWGRLLSLLILVVTTAFKLFMFTFDIVLDFSSTGYQPEVVEHLEYLMGCLYRSRQIVNEDWCFVQDPISLRVSVTCPELNSLDPQNSTLYAKNWLSKIEIALQMPVRFVPTGHDPRYPFYVEQGKPSFYILNFEGYSPLLNGDSNEPVPLYKIPFTYHDDACYDDIRFWSYNYESVYGLWFNGAVGEQFALRQMQDVDSALSKQGRAVCQRIEEVTGVPTYYFLFNYRRRSLKQDGAWKCPLCGKEWLVASAKSSDDIAFRCSESRLMSRFSQNSSR